MKKLNIQIFNQDGSLEGMANIEFPDNTKTINIQSFDSSRIGFSELFSKAEIRLMEIPVSNQQQAIYGFVSEKYEI